MVKTAAVVAVVFGVVMLGLNVWAAVRAVLADRRMRRREVQVWRGRW